MLSRSDNAVLSAILDPEAGLDVDQHACSLASSDYDTAYYDTKTLAQARQREHTILKSLNTSSPSEAAIREAIASLNVLLHDLPQYASGYSNRAQARRLLFRNLDALAHHPDDTRLILNDLAQAIALASPRNAIQPIASDASSTLSSAHTHRGYLLYKASRTKSSGRVFVAEVSDFAKLGSEQLLEMASRDFALGGRYGNKAAKQMAVHTNPYAKLCGSIVKEALRKEVEVYSGSMANS